MISLFVQTNFALAVWTWYWMDGASTAQVHCIYIEDRTCNGKCFVSKIIVQEEKNSSKPPLANVLTIKADTHPFFVDAIQRCGVSLPLSTPRHRTSEYSANLLTGFLDITTPPPKS